MWELEKIGNSDLLSQALKKQEDKSENSYRPSHSLQTLSWRRVEKAVYCFAGADFKVTE